MKAPESAPPGTTSFSVSVGPVTLPMVVDRPQLVLRVSDNRVDILEMHRWAEPLKSGSLSTTRGKPGTSTRAGSGLGSIPLECQRKCRLPGTGGHSALRGDARARCHGRCPLVGTPCRGETLKTGRSVINETASGESYDTLVAAFGRAVTAVSRDIAEVIRTEASTPH